MIRPRLKWTMLAVLVAVVAVAVALAMRLTVEPAVQSRFPAANGDVSRLAGRVAGINMHSSRGILVLDRPLAKGGVNFSEQVAIVLAPETSVRISRSPVFLPLRTLPFIDFTSPFMARYLAVDGGVSVLVERRDDKLYALQTSPASADELGLATDTSGNAGSFHLPSGSGATSGTIADIVNDGNSTSVVISVPASHSSIPTRVLIPLILVETTDLVAGNRVARWGTVRSSGPGELLFDFAGHGVLAVYRVLDGRLVADSISEAAELEDVPGTSVDSDLVPGQYGF